MHNGAAGVSKSRTKLSATERADHTLPQTFAILAECIKAKAPALSDKIRIRLPKFSGTYFLPMGQQACGLFAAVHTGSSGPLSGLFPPEH